MGKGQGTTTKVVTPNPFLKPSAIFRSPGAQTSTFVQRDDTLTESEALAQFYGWVGTPKMDQWGDHLVRAGVIDPEDARDYGTLAKWWETAVKEAGAATGAKRDIDPWKMVEFMGSASGASGSGGRSKATQPKFTGAKTQTDKSVDLTDPATAQAMVHDILSAQLGRRARPEEVSAFTAVLNNAERANPVTTTSTTNYVEDEAVSQSSTSSGGLSAAGGQELLTQQAMAKPEYGAYQAATTYFNVLQQAIGAPVQG